MTKAPGKGIRAAVVQMTSTDQVEENLGAAAGLLEEAAALGAGLVVLPENFGYMGRCETDRLSVAERPGDGPQQDFLALAAARLEISIVGGTIPVLDGDDRPRARSIVWNETGNVVGVYDKIHLFDVEVPGRERAYRESAGTHAGSEAVVVPSPLGPLGLSVCYDVRFPELYRGLVRAGALCLTVPAAFTVPTGEAHWDVLIRARAVENLAFVLAAAQVGEHPGGRRTWGHAMIVDPWGRVLGSRAAGPGVVVSDLDLAAQAGLRERFPALTHVSDFL